MQPDFSQIRLKNGNVLQVDAQGYVLDDEGNRIINREAKTYYRADRTIEAGNAEWVSRDVEGSGGSDPLAASSTDQPIVQQTPNPEEGSGITLHDVASVVAPFSTAAHDWLGAEKTPWQLIRVPAAGADVALNAFPLTAGTTKSGIAFRSVLDKAATPMNKATLLLESAGTKIPKAGNVLFKSNPVPNSIVGKGIDRLGNTFTYGREQALEKMEKLEGEADILAQRKYQNERKIKNLAGKNDEASTAMAAKLRTDNRGLAREIKTKEVDIKGAQSKIPGKLRSDPSINTREAFNRAIAFAGFRTPLNEGGRNIAGNALTAGMENVVVPVADMLGRSMEKRHGQPKQPIMAKDVFHVDTPEDKISALVDSAMYRGRGR